jgi:hypothetical protein
LRYCIVLSGEQGRIQPSNLTGGLFAILPGHDVAERKIAAGIESHSEGRPMTLAQSCTGAMVALVVSLFGVADAAEPLRKDEVIKRVSGKMLAWYSDRLASGDRPRIKFGVDGEFSLTHTGAGNDQPIETGVWHVTEKGQLCVTVHGKSQGKCFFLIPTGGDSYMLQEAMATDNGE